MLPPIPLVEGVVHSTGPGEGDEGVQCEAVLVGHGRDAGAAAGAALGGMGRPIFLLGGEERLHLVLAEVGAGHDALRHLVGDAEGLHIAGAGHGASL